MGRSRQQWVVIESVNPADYSPTRCIYTGAKFTDSEKGYESRSNEHIPPKCIGGSFSVPAACQRANNEFGSRLDHSLLASGNVQNAAMVLRRRCPELLRNCMSVQPRVRTTTTGAQLDFRPAPGNRKSLRLVRYRSNAGTGFRSCNGFVFHNLKEVAKGWNLNYHELQLLSSSQVEQPVTIHGGTVVVFDASPFEISTSEDTDRICLPAIFKIAFGFLYLYVAESVFDVVFEPYRKGFRDLIHGHLRPGDLPGSESYCGKHPADPFGFCPYHVARCNTIGNAIEIEVALFDHIRICYLFPHVHHSREQQSVEFRSKLVNPSSKSNAKARRNSTSNGTRLFVVFTDGSEEVIEEIRALARNPRCAPQRVGRTSCSVWFDW